MRHPIATTIPFPAFESSWQTVPFQHNTIRAFSSITPSYDRSSRFVRPASRSAKCALRDRSARSRSSILQDPVHRRAFHATTRRLRDHHFDTLKFVQRLQEEGFTEAQSVAMMKVLSDVIEESIQNLPRTMVLREIKLKLPIPKKWILQSYAPSFFPRIPPNLLPLVHLTSD